ncbi:efflux RND transporter periplasmic adaptor subunit [Thiomicrospira sp. R3]|uniref:efflux RND transporter periplasmic adaptor subunit n=1 Tax=Thiomicrospira sp. R3 TaxID=3035472 RepID=UPI00259BE56F|nr:efflux RND transporter periplasmic adaptor subunit [Thiomicrospira sp. R3]WFE68225.1 efflux RND transporter periplasmic adaptor subunit [Thiomicrospira sp. R3]
MFKLKHSFKIFFIGTLSLSMLSGCQHQAESEPSEHLPFVLVSHVQQGGEQLDSLLGRIESQTLTSLSFQIPGLVTKRHVQIGDSVRTGQTLIQLDATDLTLKQRAAQANLNATESELKLAQTEAKRAQDLLNRNLVSQQDFDRAQNQVTSLHQRLVALQRELDLVKRQLDYAQLSSPVNGLVQFIQAQPGLVVQPGQTLIEIFSQQQDILVKLPESRIASAKQQGFIQLPTGEQIPVSLRETTPAADPASNTWTVRYALPENTQLKLGQTAKLVFSTPDQQLKLPKSAVFDLGQGTGVWLYQEGIVQFKPVKLTQLTQDFAFVQAELSPNDQVVSAGVHLLKAGQKVQTRQLQEPTL